PAPARGRHRTHRPRARRRGSGPARRGGTLRLHALLLLAACGTATAPPEVPPPVDCVPVEVGTAIDTVTLSGPVRPPPSQAALARLDAARADVARARVPSPIRGQVARVLVRLGQTVDTLTPLVEVVDVSQLEIAVSVPADVLARLRIDQPARVRLGDVAID